MSSITPKISSQKLNSIVLQNLSIFKSYKLNQANHIISYEVQPESDSLFASCISADLAFQYARSSSRETPFA